jgi:hypothetical protein
VTWKLAGPRSCFGKVCRAKYLYRILKSHPEIGERSRQARRALVDRDNGVIPDELVKSKEMKCSHDTPAQDPPAQDPPAQDTETPSLYEGNRMDSGTSDLTSLSQEDVALGDKEESTCPKSPVQTTETEQEYSVTEKLQEENARLQAELTQLRNLVKNMSDKEDSNGEPPKKKCKDSGSSIESLKPLFESDPWTKTPADVFKDEGKIPVVPLRQILPLWNDHRVENYAPDQKLCGKFKPTGQFPGQSRVDSFYLKDRKQSPENFTLLLPNGHWPLVLASRRDWGAVPEESITVPCGQHVALSWPPKGWRKMTPSEKLRKFIWFVSHYHRRYYGEDDVQHRRTMTDRWHPFMLPGSDYLDMSANTQTSALDRAARMRVQMFQLELSARRSGHFEVLPPQFMATPEIQKEWEKDPNLVLPIPVLEAMEDVPLASYSWENKVNDHHVWEASGRYVNTLGKIRQVESVKNVPSS